MARFGLALAAAFHAASLHGAAAADLAVCPGENDRYGDHKCNHDQTHRFCAQLLSPSGELLSWGPKGDFWQITGQKAFQWDDQIRANNGDSWCICMWAAARLISEVGCENVHLHCEATDVDYIVKQYSDGGVDLEPAKQCLMQKCPVASPIQRDDAAVPQLADGAGASTPDMPSQLGLGLAAPAFVVLSVVAAGALLWRMRSEAARSSSEDVDVAAAGIE